MKKIILVVAVIMIAVMLTALFVGCSAEDYVKQLEKKDYNVTIVRNEGALGSAAMQGAVASLKGMGVDIKGDMEYVIVGVKEKSTVMIIKFEKTSDASSVRKQAKAEMKDEDLEGATAKVGGIGKIVKFTIEEK